MSDLEFEKEKEQEQTEQYGDRLEFDDVNDETNDDIEIPEEDGQLALFDVPEVKKPAKGSKKKPAGAKTPPVEEKVDSEFIVCYAGHKIPVPHNDMTLEQVREILEKDFPEMTKQRAKLEVDKEKKQVIAFVHGGKHG